MVGVPRDCSGSPPGDGAGSVTQGQGGRRCGNLSFHVDAFAGRCTRGRVLHTHTHTHKCTLGGRWCSHTLHIHVRRPNASPGSGTGSDANSAGSGAGPGPPLCQSNTCTTRRGCSHTLKRAHTYATMHTQSLKYVLNTEQMGAGQAKHTQAIGVRNLSTRTHGTHGG